MNKQNQLIIIITFLFSYSIFANIAKVTMIRGNAFIQLPNKSPEQLKLDDWVQEGSKILTKEKSVVKLVFTDKSQMNIGPNSEMAINKFGGGEAGLISVIKGEIRSQVTKDVLKHDDKSKLLIKTKSAAMGIRGTDFSVVFNPENNNTSLITYEGQVVLAQINEAESAQANPAQFEQIVSDPGRSVSVPEGLYAGANPSLGHATIPTKISPMQYEQMKTNETFEEKKAESGDTKSYGSPLPPGISTKVATNDNTQTLDAQVKTQVTAEKLEENAKELTAAVNAPPAEGFVDPNTGAVAPVAGGFLDTKTGIYIAPPPGSVYDPNTKVYVPPASYGTIDASGSYKAPEGLKLTAEGQFVPDAKAQAPTTSTGAGGAQTKTQTTTTTETAKAAGTSGTNTVSAAKGTAPAPPVIMPVTAMMAAGPSFATNQEVAQQTVQMVAANGTNAPQGPPPVNDVLGGGFFIPGNYFIDTVPTNIASDVVIKDTSTVNFNISTP